MKDSQYFKSSYSKLILLTTIIGMISMHAVFMLCIGGMKQNILWSNHFWAFAFLFLLSTSFVLYAFAIQIKGVTISNNNLIIHKKLSKIIIVKEDINKAERITHLNFFMRVWGISYFFGHYGIYRNPYLGKFYIHVKNPKQMLTIHTSKRTYIISCDNSESLLQLLKKNNS